MVRPASIKRNSRRTTLAMGLGVTRKYQYDSRSLLTTLLYLDGSTPLATYVGTYDPAGNRVGRLEGANVLTTWLYDAKYRLLGQERTGQAATYVYDDVDNLLVKHEEGSAPMTFTYDAASRPVSALQGTGVTTLTWSPRGVLTQELRADGSLTTYVHSSVRNQLVYAQPSPGTNSSYTYDADGMRLRTLEGGVWATMVWDDGDYVAVNRSGADDSLFVLMDGEVLGEILGSEARDYLADPLGSVRGGFDSSQDLRDPVSYWPYGERLLSLSPPWGTLFWLGTLGYYQDPGNRSYVRAREYDQVLASWLQVDPLWPGEPGFGYVRGMPVTAVDPSGLSFGTNPLFCKSLNEYVFQYCNDCHRGALIGDPFCRKTCSTMAESYHRLCTNPWRRPNPGEDWAPGGGILGPPSAIVPVVPPSEPCHRPRVGPPQDKWFKKDCNQAYNLCLAALDQWCSSGAPYLQKICASLQAGCAADWLACKAVESVLGRTFHKS